MAWTTSKSSAITFVLDKVSSALLEVRKQEIAGTETDESVAKILCEAVDLCREKIAKSSHVEVKDKIIITTARLLEMVVVLMRVARQIDEKGLTVEINGLLEKSGLAKRHELQVV